jgi:hypothetical protein
MSFPTLRFAAFFLLLALGWHLLPGKLKKVWLLLGCLTFYALAGGAWIVLLAGETLLVWLLALAAEKQLWGKAAALDGAGPVPDPGRAAAVQICPLFPE